MSSPQEEEQNKVRPLGMGHHMSLAFKQAIINLSDYFRSKNKDWSVRQMTREISEALKISERAVTRILSEKKHNKCMSEPKKRSRKNNGYTFESMDKQIIETIIKDIYSHKELPEIKCIFNALKDQKYEYLTQNLSFKSCSLSTFYKIFHKIGFKYSSNLKRPVKKRGPRIHKTNNNNDLIE